MEVREKKDVNFSQRLGKNKMSFNFSNKMLSSSTSKLLCIFLLAVNSHSTFPKNK